jgi:hypothetical protein
MKTILASILLCTPVLFLQAADPAPTKAAPAPANPQIDFPGFEKIAREVAPVRERRRLTEEQFAAMAVEKGTIVLDARSADKFAMRHIDGAVSLPFTDFTAASLAKVIPAKDTRILIYCNNNFRGAPRSMARKVTPRIVTDKERPDQVPQQVRDQDDDWGRGAASLNISTYIALATYGYTNIYELGPLLDVSTTKLPFVGSEVAPQNGPQVKR